MTAPSSGEAKVIDDSGFGEGVCEAEEFPFVRFDKAMFARQTPKAIISPKMLPAKIAKNISFRIYASLIYAKTSPLSKKGRFVRMQENKQIYK